MSFIDNGKKGQTYAPGWFLADNENCSRLTMQIEAGGEYVKQTEDGGAYAPMGSIYPTNDASAIGIIYEDVDVSNGDMPGSVVVSGVIYGDRLPVEASPEALEALEKVGVVVEETKVERPY